MSGKLKCYYWCSTILNHVQSIRKISLCLAHYWGEPERAPHRRVECLQSIYMVRPSPVRHYIHCTATIKV